MKRTCHFILFLTLTLAMFQAGCTPKNQPAGNKQVPPAASPTVPAATSAPAIPSAVSRSIHLDPSVVEDADSALVSGFLYDSLTRLDASGKPQAALATQWTVSDDQLDYVVVLRQGVTFHSGAAFNADAVMANFNRWFDPANSLHGSADYPGWKKAFLAFKGDLASDGTPASPFDGIEKVDEHTVLIHLNRPMPDLLTDLASPSFAILNPALLASSGATTGTSAATVDGTGAYFVSSWSDSGLVLAPNSTYWGGAPASNLQFAWK
ncbi:MAG TPA: ABC transporter substrate-binding protein [Anaerolineales bacterium]|nr:ABC transporter substrate-binding protein [Anaerolineales bacterium]